MRKLAIWIITLFFVVPLLINVYLIFFDKHNIINKIKNKYNHFTHIIGFDGINIFYLLGIGIVISVPLGLLVYSCFKLLNLFISLFK